MSTGNFIESSIKQFRYYKWLADQAIVQLTDDQLLWRPNGQSNSIAIIMRHLSGNMLSRFTNFLTDDGEKSWRNRDAEFAVASDTREELLHKWEEAWTCMISELSKLRDSDLEKIVYIRNEGHTVTEAVHRQLAHYPYHVGQIVSLAKAQAQSWRSLSIPLNQSAQYNDEKFAKEKMRAHFTDEILNRDPENDLVN